MTEPQAGGWGAGHNKDGEDDLFSIADGETYVMPVEVCETRYGLLVDQYGFDICEDNRVVVVSLTPAGREIAQNAPLGGIPLLREQLKTLAPERLALIDEALAEIRQLLRIEDEQ